MSTTESAAARSPVLQAAVGDLDHELANTRRVLERVPEEHLEWRPHEKSGSLAWLAGHVANLPFWQTTIITQEGLDLATLPRNLPLPTSRDEILRSFDERVAELRKAVPSLDPDSLGRPWTLRNGEHVIFTMPKGAVLRGMGMNHLVHHRGQLTVYLRMLGAPVPGLYGPSADEQ